MGAVAFRPVFGVDGKDTPMISRFGVLVAHVPPVLCVETCKILGVDFWWMMGRPWILIMPTYDSRLVQPWNTTYAYRCMYICIYVCIHVYYTSHSRPQAPVFFPIFLRSSSSYQGKAVWTTPPIEVQACCFSKQLQRGIKTLEEMMDRKVRNPAKDGKDVVLDEIKI